MLGSYTGGCAGCRNKGQATCPVRIAAPFHQIGKMTKKPCIRQALADLAIEGVVPFLRSAAGRASWQNTDGCALGGWPTCFQGRQTYQSLPPYVVGDETWLAAIPVDPRLGESFPLCFPSI